MTVCTASTEVRPCYSGFTATEGKGTCKGGQQTCKDDGSGFGDCMGEVLPAMADDCAKSLDTTCDGKLTCPCTPKEEKPCYDGMPASTAGVGTCKGGTHTCDDDGKGFGECVGQVKPAAEDCTTQLDENCDGIINGAAGGCVCDPTQAVLFNCMTGLPGVCNDGTQPCAADGKGYGACTAKPTFHDCFTPTDKDCYGMSPIACAGTSILAGAPGASTDDEGVFSVAIDAMGNIFLGGVSGSSEGSSYAVKSGAADITKLDKNGAQIWKKSYPATGVIGDYSVVRGVAVDGKGNVLIIGEYRGAIASNGVAMISSFASPDVFVIKLDTDGNLQWSKSFGGSGDQFGVSISTAANGDAFIIGRMDLTMTFGTNTLTAKGSSDVFVAKLAADTGDSIWRKNYGDASFQYGWDVAATPDGNVAITGQYDGNINFDSGDLGNKGGRDIFVAKLSGSDGAQVWANHFGEKADQIGRSIAVDSKGNIVVIGSVQGKTNFGDGEVDVGDMNPSDLFVASFAPDGTNKWSKFFGDPSNPQEGRDVAVDAAGNILVTGYFSGTLKFDNSTTLMNPMMPNGPVDVFVAKFKGTDGSFGWARSFGDTPNDQVGRAIAVDLLGNAIVAGTFKGTIDFGPPTTALTSQNNTFDSFWAKLAP